MPYSSALIGYKMVPSANRGRKHKLQVVVSLIVSLILSVSNSLENRVRQQLFSFIDSFEDFFVNGVKFSDGLLPTLSASLSFLPQIRSPNLDLH